MSLSPFSLKCETRCYYARLTSQANGDTRNKGTSHIGCMCPKMLGLTLSLATLSNFSKPPSAHSSVASDTIAPLPPTVQDTGPRARRRLIPGLRVYHCVVHNLAGGPSSTATTHLRSLMPSLARPTLVAPSSNLASLTP
jgi:hypothetical protein